jgi:predicted peptidase
VLIYLHGAWPRSDDKLEIPQKEDLVKYIQAHPQPMIVLAPQCPADRAWSRAFLRPWLDKAMAEYRIDPDRVYLAGGSMGGFGSYLWAADEPQLFAAVVPVCGGADPRLASRLKSTPLWAFHGDKDDVVPLRLDQQIIEPLKALGAPAKLTVYEGVGHEVGRYAYDTPGLWEWLLAQHRPAP